MTRKEFEVLLKRKENCSDWVSVVSTLEDFVVRGIDDLAGDAVLYSIFGKTLEKDEIFKSLSEGYEVSFSINNTEEELTDENLESLFTRADFAIMFKGKEVYAKDNILCSIVTENYDAVSTGVRMLIDNYESHELNEILIHCMLDDYIDEMYTDEESSNDFEEE